MSAAGPRKPRRKAERPKRSPGRGPKPNLARLAAVEKLIAAQCSNSQIVKQIQEQFGCKERAVYYDLARVWGQLEKDAEEERPRRKGQMRATLRSIMQHAIARKDLKSAIGAARELSKLDGLYADTSVRVNVGGSIDVRSQKLLDALKLTPVERARRIAELQGSPVGSGHRSVENPEDPDASVEDDEEDEDDDDEERADA